MYIYLLDFLLFLILFVIRFEHLVQKTEIINICT